MTMPLLFGVHVSVDQEIAGLSFFKRDLPKSVVLNPGSRYLWRLEARVGWDMWEASELIEFHIEPAEHEGQPESESHDDGDDG